MASRPRKKCAFFNKGQGLQDLKSFLIEGCHQSTSKQGDCTVDQACKDIIKVQNLVQDVELVDSKKTGSNCCSNVNIENSVCPSLTKPSAHTNNSEHTNFNGIILGSVAALEDSEHSYAPTQTTLNRNGYFLDNSSVDDTALCNTYTPEKKVYTQLLSVQTCQFDARQPYACSASPSKHKVQSDGSIENSAAPLSSAEKLMSPCYDEVNDAYNDRTKGQHPPPRPYTRRPSHPYCTYSVPSPSEECWLPKRLNTVKGEFSAPFQSSYCSALSYSSSSSVVEECSPVNKKPRSCSKPSSTAMSEHGAPMRGCITGTEFNRTAQQNQQPPRNCNHLNSDIPPSKSNILVNASIQYDQGGQAYSHDRNISYPNGIEQNYLPPATTVYRSSALHHRNLYVPFSGKSSYSHLSGSSGDSVLEELNPSSSLRDHGAPIHVPPPVDAIGLSAFTRVMPQRGYPQHRAAITVAGSYHHSGEPYSPPVLNYSTTVNGSSCSDDSNPVFPSSSTTERKRVQSCKLCRNHGVETPIKGHKYLCPYKKCQCKKCSITLNSRHCVKEQLRITRKQNVSASLHLSDCEDQHNEAKQPPATGVFFSMKEDMVKDIEKLNNLKLFMEIDKICRPQSSMKDSKNEKMES